MVNAGVADLLKGSYVAHAREISAVQAANINSTRTSLFT